MGKSSVTSLSMSYVSSHGWSCVPHGRSVSRGRLSACRGHPVSWGTSDVSSPVRTPKLASMRTRGGRRGAVTRQRCGRNYTVQSSSRKSPAKIFGTV